MLFGNPVARCAPKTLERVKLVTQVRTSPEGLPACESLVAAHGALDVGQAVKWESRETSALPKASLFRDGVDYQRRIRSVGACRAVEQHDGAAR